jgi:predicted GNAT family acetyltransferase
MNLSIYPTASDFLAATHSALEAQESANNLMYGLALRLDNHPERIKAAPYFAVVHEGEGLLVAALMTPPFNLVVLSCDPTGGQPAFNLVVRDLLANGVPVPGVIGPTTAALAFARAWQAATAQDFSLVFHERVYELRAVSESPHPGGWMRPALPGDLDLCARWLVAFQEEAVPLERQSLAEAHEGMSQRIADWDIYLWEDGVPVALAGRTRPTPHGWTIGPVYTPPEQRRKGYATALTAELSQLILDAGKQFVTLFTDLANPTSNSIYQKIGFRPVCDFDLYRFSRI